MISVVQNWQVKLQRWLRVPWIRISINAFGAALIWGSWAAFIHRDHPLTTLLKAALTQAFISAFFTLVGASLLEAVFARAPRAARVPLSAMITFAFILTSVLIIHSWAQTPNILYTVAPTMTLSFFYCFGYAASLKKLSSAN